MENTFRFDSTDPQLLRELIREYSGSKSMFSGTNTEGERMTISIAETGIVTNTFQSNGWVRVNYYGTDGLPEGETFDGKWK
jgi:hypothetical protein